MVSRNLLAQGIGVVLGVAVITATFFLHGTAQTTEEQIGVEVSIPSDEAEVPKPGPGEPETRATLIVEGFGPPNSLLMIFIDGALARTAAIPLSGNFSAELTGLDPGLTTVGVAATDPRGDTTPTISLSLVLHEGTVTRIFNLLLPPTIRASNTSVRAGERVELSGYTHPDARVRVTRAPDRQVQEVAAGPQGRWSFLYATDSLVGTYTASGRSIMPSGAISETSFEVIFSVIPRPGVRPEAPRPPGVAPPPREGPPPICADLNGDRVVNLPDFSILLFNWGAPKDPRTDCNGDGVVDLIDFSVMLFWWTG